MGEWHPDPQTPHQQTFAIYLATLLTRCPLVARLLLQLLEHIGPGPNAVAPRQATGRCHGGCGGRGC